MQLVRMKSDWLLKKDSTQTIPGVMLETITPAGSQARAMNGLSRIGSQKYVTSITWLPAISHYDTSCEPTYLLFLSLTIVSGVL